MSPDSIRRTLARRGSDLAATVVNETNRLVGSNATTVERADANRTFLDTVEKPGEQLSARTRRARRELMGHLLRADEGTTLFALSTGRTTWAGPSGVFGKALALVETAIDENDLVYATGVVEQLLTERPQSPRAHELRGILEAAAGNWAAARKDWRLAERRNYTDAEKLRTALDRRVRREKTLVRLREAVAGWAASHDLDALDETTRSLADQVLTAARGPRLGDELEAALEALLVHTVIRDETAAVSELFDAYAALRSRTSPRAEPDWLTVAAKEANALSDDSDFAAAARVVESVAATPAALRINQFLFLWARLLSATSRYDAADAVLGLVTAPPEDVSQAQLHRARTAWITHRYPDGEVAAQAALAADPERHAAARMLEQVRTAARSRAEAGAADSVAHVAYYPGPTGNFGDAVLPVAVRSAFESATTSISWRPYQAHQVVDDVTVDQFNAQRAVVVGGGGLFLPDTSPNGSSGWQWNIDNDHLDRVTAPLALFAVGYNLFPGQSFKGSVFHDSIVKVAEKAQFLGLRNHGSIDQVRSILPRSLQDKVRYVPCPTTILSRIRPLEAEAVPGRGRVLLNAAFDRRSRRFGEGYRDFLEQMAQLVRGVRDDGVEIAYAAHLASDERLVKDLRRTFDLELPVERLYEYGLDESLSVYRDASLVIGMRGHATMVPFGLGTPVLSIVSHPKMRYFLEDIGRPEWGFDAAAPDLAAGLVEAVRDKVAREDAARREVHQLQEQLVEPVFSAARSLLG